MGSSVDLDFRPEESLDLTEIYKMSHGTRVSNLELEHFSKVNQHNYAGDSCNSGARLSWLGEFVFLQFVLLGVPTTGIARSRRNLQNVPWNLCLEP